MKNRSGEQIKLASIDELLGVVNEESAINIPVDVKHWHGAAPDEWFSHLAIEVPGVDCSNEWCEAVSEKEYAGLR